MVFENADGESDLTQTPIADEDYYHIGRLMRAFAEIDDLVTLYICNLAEINEARASVLLGRSPLSAKINIARTLADMTNEHIAGTHKDIFDSQLFIVANKYRNFIAHGAYLGLNDEGCYCFLSANITEATDEIVRMQVLSIDPKSLAEVATKITDAIAKIEEHLKLTALRGRRAQQRLGPHPKGQSRRRRGVKPQPPPQSSPQ